MYLCLPWEVAVVEEDEEGLPARGEKRGVGGVSFTRRNSTRKGEEHDSRDCGC